MTSTVVNNQILVTPLLIKVLWNWGKQFVYQMVLPNAKNVHSAKTVTHIKIK